MVISDDYLGAYQGVVHLIEQGCRRIAHFAGKQHIHIYQNRLKGYLQALEDHNLDVDEELIIESDLIQNTYRIVQTGYQMGKKLMKLPQPRSEEHTSELQSRGHLVCRLLLEKKKNK